jgi:hypothetical protein
MNKTSPVAATLQTAATGVILTACGAAARQPPPARQPPFRPPPQTSPVPMRGPRPPSRPAHHATMGPDRRTR